MSETLPRCAQCGGVIGVYEPAIQIAGESRCTTSRAAQPDLASSAQVYHAVCYEPGRDPAAG